MTVSHCRKSMVQTLAASCVAWTTQGAANVSTSTPKSILLVGITVNFLSIASAIGVPNLLSQIDFILQTQCTTDRWSYWQWHVDEAALHVTRITWYILLLKFATIADAILGTRLKPRYEANWCTYKQNNNSLVPRRNLRVGIWGRDYNRAENHAAIFARACPNHR